MQGDKQILKGHGMHNFINSDSLIAYVREEINQSMIAAAEPLIQEALKNVEVVMREKMAQHIISMIESNFVVSKRENELVIIVKQAAHPFQT